MIFFPCRFEACTDSASIDPEFMLRLMHFLIQHFTSRLHRFLSSLTSISESPKCAIPRYSSWPTLSAFCAQRGASHHPLSSGDGTWFVLVFLVHRECARQWTLSATNQGCSTSSIWFSRTLRVTALRPSPTENLHRSGVWLHMKISVSQSISSSVFPESLWSAPRGKDKTQCIHVGQFHSHHMRPSVSSDFLIYGKVSP